MNEVVIDSSPTLGHLPLSPPMCSRPRHQVRVSVDSVVLRIAFIHSTNVSDATSWVIGE